MAVAITRTEHGSASLRRLAASSRDSDAARRMLALALVLEGASRTDAARLCGMDRQTLRDWVHRYNVEGIAGLSDRRESRGRKPLLSAEHAAMVAELVQNGPDQAIHGVVRWQRIDLARAIEQRFGIRPDERTVGKLLRRLGFRPLSVRPRHPGHDAEAQAAHKKTSPAWSPPSSRSTRAASRSNSGGRTRPASASRAR
jgi:transposase